MFVIFVLGRAGDSVILVQFSGYDPIMPFFGVFFTFGADCDTKLGSKPQVETHQLNSIALHMSLSEPLKL